MLVRLLVGLIVASVLVAQAPAPAGQARPGRSPPIRAFQVNEVIVPVTVTDEKDRFVSNLEVKDFQIYDQGREQKIVYFSRERNQPVVVGFLLDMSNATRLHWKKFQEAALELVFNLLPGDPQFSGYLITYANEAELAVNTTSDSEKHRRPDSQAEARRRRGPVRRHLHGLHPAQPGRGRADRAAAHPHHHRRRSRHRQQQEPGRKCWNWRSATWSPSTE